MQRKPVSSSNIVSVGYNPEIKTLEVEFKGGGVYSYPGVTDNKYHELINADSIGSHFHKHIRGTHDGVKVDK